MEKAFIKPYEQGWASKPAENSWVTPQIMDNYDQAINEIDNRVIGISEDLTQISEDLEKQKNGVTNFESGKKLESNGTVSDEPNNCVSEYIDVTNHRSVKVYISDVYQATPLIMVEYSTTKTFVDYWGVQSQGGRSFDLKSNTKYIRFTFEKGFKGYIVDNSTQEVIWESEKTLNGDINVLKENLTPNGYISSGLTYTNCSYVNGGYCKIGNLVVINMRVTATNPTFNVSGFPSYSGFIPVNSVALNVFDASSNSTTSQPIGMVEASGKITVVKATNNYIYFLSATYIAN